MSLKRQAAEGAYWTGTSSIIVAALQFGQLVVLARLLDRSDFGLMAMLMVVAGFAEVYTDVGFNRAIIFRQDVTRAQLSSLYWFNIVAGIAVFTLFWAATPLIVAFYDEPNLRELVFWVALSIVITPIGQQFSTLLQKHLRFSVLAKVQVKAAIVGSVAAVTCAIAGLGVWSFVWGQLANRAMSTLLLTAIGWRNWRPRLAFHWRDLQGYLGFGFYQIGERSINYISANVDYLIVGRFFGPEILGAYTLAYRLVAFPLMKINPALTIVAFPIFARKQHDDAALRRGYLEMIKLLASVACPALVGLAVVAPVFVPVVFGPGWDLAVPLVQILAAVGILKTLGNPSGSVFLAKGRADIGFKWNMFLALTNTACFLLAAPYGVFAIASTYAVLTVLYFFGDRWLLYRVIRLKLGELFSALTVTWLMTIGMATTVLLAHTFLGGAIASETASLIALIGLGAAVYCGSMWIFEKRFVKSTIALLLKRDGGLA